MLNSSEQAALDLIMRKPDYVPYFFNKISKPEFFQPLKEKGFFDAANAPTPTPDKDGYASIPQWVVLPYLEKIAKHIPDIADKDVQKRHIGDILQIIHAVTQKRAEALQQDRDSLTLDNFRTWWSFSKILSNLPNHSISKETIELFRVWMHSKFTSMPVRDTLELILPKFLTASAAKEDIEKAEQMTEIFLEIKPASPEKFNRTKYVMVVDDSDLLDVYFEKGFASRLGEGCSKEFVFKIADKLFKVLSEENDSSHLSVEEGDSEYLLVVHKLNGKFTCELKKRKKPESLDIWSSQAGFEPMFPASQPLDYISADECVTEIKIYLNSANLSESVFQKLVAKLPLIPKHFWDDLSSIWFKSLAETDARGHHEAAAMLLQVLRNILQAKAKAADPSQIKSIFSELIEKYRFYAFKRLVLYCYAMNYSIFKNDFWKWAKAVPGEIFGRSHLEAEVYLLLEKNVLEFDKTIIEDLISLIETGPTDSTREYTDLQKSYWRQKWYSALIKNATCKERYDFYFEKTKEKEFINSRDSHMRWGPGPSPLSKEEILRMPTEELARFIPEFELKARNTWDDPNPEALAHEIKAAAAENPQHFVGNLSPFINTGYHYVCFMLLGFWECLNKSKVDSEFTWDKLLVFFKTYIDRPEFWEDKFTSKREDARDYKHSSIISSVADLFQLGLASNSQRAIPDNYLADVEALIFLSSRVIPPPADKLPEPSNSLFDSLNSEAGKLLRATLYLSLRLAPKKKPDSATPCWKKELKEFYGSVLARKNVDAHTVFGEHLGNFVYLDRTWTIAKIKEFESLPDVLWEAFMTGFLHSGHVYNEYYSWASTHYLRAIPYKFVESHAEEALAQHIAIFYLRGFDQLKEGELLSALIKNGNSTHIDRLIGYIRIQGPDDEKSNEKEIERLRPLVLNLWRHLYSHYSSQGGILLGRNRSVFAELCDFITFLPKLDAESAMWIEAGAKQFRPWGDAWDLFKHLSRLKDIGNPIENAGYLAQIFKAIPAGSLPDRDEDDIVGVLTLIHDHRPKDAVEIRDRYLHLNPDCKFIRERCGWAS